MSKELEDKEYRVSDLSKNIFSNGDLIHYTCSHIPLRIAVTNLRNIPHFVDAYQLANPLLGRLARVNKVFFEVIQHTWKKELSAEEIIRFLTSEAQNIDTIKFFITCNKFQEIPLSKLAESLAVAAGGGYKSNNSAYTRLPAVK